LNKRFESKQRGGGCGGITSGWSYGGRSEYQKKGEGSSTNYIQKGDNPYHPHQNNGDQRGRGRFGRGPGRGGFRGTFFQCRGHRAYECPQYQGRKNGRPKGKNQVTHVDEDVESSHYEYAKRG
jgi:hypothetical protein